MSALAIFLVSSFFIILKFKKFMKKDLKIENKKRRESKNKKKALTMQKKKDKLYYILTIFVKYK